ADDADKLGALGAVSLTGTATSGASDLTYDVAVNLGGVGGVGKFTGKVTGLPDAPRVDTRLDFAAQKPAPLLALVGMAGPQANRLGPLVLSAKATGSTASATLSDLSLKAGQNSLAGNMKFDQTTGARPFVTAALRGGVVDLTPFSPPGKKGGGNTGGGRWS